MARRVLPLRICCVHRSTSSGTKYLCIIGVWALFRLRSLTRFAGGAGRSSTCVPKFVGRCLPSASLPGVSPLSGGGHRNSRTSCASEFSSSSQAIEISGRSLGPMGEYYRAFVVTEERVTKWPAPRDEVEYDVLRVSVNVHIN